MTTFTFHNDAGHGWLAVPEGILAEVELTAGDFSAYSYQGHGVVYLEEDCDAAIFLAAWESHFGAAALDEVYDGNQSFIRDMPRIEPSEADADVWF